MDVVDSLYKVGNWGGGFHVLSDLLSFTSCPVLVSQGYADIPPFGDGPDQQKLHRLGNTYIREKFPLTDFLLSCTVLEAPVLTATVPNINHDPAPMASLPLRPPPLLRHHPLPRTRKSVPPAATAVPRLEEPDESAVTRSLSLKTTAVPALTSMPLYRVIAVVSTMVLVLILLFKFCYAAFNTHQQVNKSN